MGLVVRPEFMNIRPVHKKPKTGTVTPPPGEEEPDDLTTWPSTTSFDTLPLPANVAQILPYFLFFEVTRRLSAAAIAASTSIRFTTASGVRLGHVRTSGGRYFVGGLFAPGVPISIRVYWGKAAVTQPGVGFPTAAEMMAPLRLALIFESSNPVDISPDPATFTEIGAPTFVTGLNGQAMSCANGKYAQTTAAKVRGNARAQRHMFALMYMPTGDSNARTICWADWTNNQRSLQLFADATAVELYVDDDGVSPYQRWRNETAQPSGWNFIGCSWAAGVDTALVQRNSNVVLASKGFPEGPTQGQLHNSTSPYIVGGTPIVDNYHAGLVEAVLELKVSSANPILFEITPTGAGATTAGYDGLPPGVASSRSMAAMDIGKCLAFADRFEIAGEKYGVPPALLAAISSRETRCGSGLDVNGEGDSGNAVGIMQIDKRYFTPVPIGADFASQGHIDQATSILAGFIAEAKAAYPAWSAAVQLQAGTAAYNGGPEVFPLGPTGFDAGTDGLDYSNDVLARAQYYAENISLFAEVSSAQMKAFDLAWRDNEQFLGIDRTPVPFDAPDVTNQELNTEVGFARVRITGISAATPISISGSGSPTFAISSSETGSDDVRAKGSAAATINDGQYVRTWMTTSGLYSTTLTSLLTVGASSSPRVCGTKAAPGTGGGSGIPTGTATYTVTSLTQLMSVINNNLAPGQIVELAEGDYRSQGTLTISGKDWSGGAKAVVRASSLAYRGPHPSQGGLFVSGESSFTAGSKGAEVSGLNILNCNNLVLEGFRLYIGAGYEASWYQFITSVNNCVFRNCRFAGLKPSGYPAGWITGSPAYTWVTERVPKGLAIKEAVNSIFEKCLFQYVQRGLWIIGGNSLYSECVWTDTAGDLVYMSHTNSGQVFRKCVIFRTFAPTTSFHCDSLQCTAKDVNCSANQTYDMVLIGPGNSAYPHVQGPFLEQDNAAFSGPDNVIIKDSVIENRTANALYMRPARNCQAVNVTSIQNQFGGIDTNNRDTLIHTPIINFNPNGLSRGGNVISKSVYVSSGLGGSDSISGSYQLLPASYAAELFDYPLYSAGLWRPCMFLNGYCAVDATELKRMAPKTTAPFHPNQADIGAHRLFDYYGALP